MIVRVIWKRTGSICPEEKARIEKEEKEGEDRNSRPEKCPSAIHIRGCKIKIQSAFFFSVRHEMAPAWNPLYADYLFFSRKTPLPQALTARLR